VSNERVSRENLRAVGPGGFPAPHHSGRSAAVRDVVVVRDGRPVAPLRVATPAQARLLGRGSERAERPNQSGELHELLGPQAHVGQARAERGEGGEEVALDVQVAGP